MVVVLDGLMAAEEGSGALAAVGTQMVIDADADAAVGGAAAGAGAVAVAGMVMGVDHGAHGGMGKV